MAAVRTHPKGRQRVQPARRIRLLQHRDRAASDPVRLPVCGRCSAGAAPGGPERPIDPLSQPPDNPLPVWIGKLVACDSGRATNDVKVAVDDAILGHGRGVCLDTPPAEPPTWLNKAVDPMDDEGNVHISPEPGLGQDIN